MHPATNVSELKKQCDQTTCFSELVVIALSELAKFSEGAEVVCGPISTGGRGIELNLRIFEMTILALAEQGRPMFSQIPYEEKIFSFRNKWREEDPTRATQYYMPILEDFYRHLFETGRIRTAWFIPGWESSFGACWEREHLVSCGARIIDLDQDWVEQMIMRIRRNECAS